MTTNRRRPSGSGDQGAEPDAGGLQRRVLETGARLAPRLRQLADRILTEPQVVADSSLRAAAGRWGIAPAGLSRLARALGYPDYAALRRACRQEADLREQVFASRARAASHRGARRRSGVLAEHVEAAQLNLALLGERVSEADLERTATLMLRAGRVVLVGALSSAALIDYFAYLGTLVFGNWQAAGRSGSPLAAGIAELSARDLVILVSTRPYAQASVDAARQAVERGVPLLVFTDLPTSPVADMADVVFCLPSDGPNLLSSHVAPLVLFEASMAAAMRKAGRRALAHVERLERAYRQAGVYWSERG